MLRTLPTNAQIDSWRSALGHLAVPYILTYAIFNGAQYHPRFP